MQRTQLIIVSVVVALVAILMVVGMLQGSFGAGTPAPAAGGAAPAPAPANTPPAPPVGTLPPPPPPLTLTTNQELDRIRIGPRLPFAIPNLGQIDATNNALQSGKGTFAASDAGTIETLASDGAGVWVWVVVEPSNKRSLLGRSVATAERVVPPMLVVEGGENAGNPQVQAVGLFYMDARQRAFVLEPQLGIRGLSQAPELVASRQDQKLWMLFRVPRGGVIKSLFLGRKKVAEWEPAVRVE